MGLNMQISDLVRKTELLEEDRDLDPVRGRGGVCERLAMKGGVVLSVDGSSSHRGECQTW